MTLKNEKRAVERVLEVPVVHCDRKGCTAHADERDAGSWASWDVSADRVGYVCGHLCPDHLGDVMALLKEELSRRPHG